MIKLLLLLIIVGAIIYIGLKSVYDYLTGKKMCESCSSKESCEMRNCNLK